MGLIDDKRNIYNTIAAYKSLGEGVEIPDPTDSISSINNASKDPTQFLVDLLVSLVGSTGLVQGLGELMTTFIRDVEDDIKSELKKQATTFNSDEAISGTSFSSGYTVSLKSIDVYEKLKTDPSSDIGNLIYSNDTNSLDQKIYEAIVADGGIVVYKTILEIVYNNTSDTITLTPVDGSLSVGDFLTEYIDGLDLINENVFTSDMINLLYGTISSNQDKNLQNAVLEEKLQVVIEKLINEFEDLLFTPEELRLIEEKAAEKNEGVDLADIGCSDRVSNISVDQLQDLVNANTGNTNPYDVGLNYLALLGDSFDPTDIAAENNLSTIADSYFKRLITAILQILIKVSSLTPETRILTSIIDGLKNAGSISVDDPFDDINANRNFFDCIVKNAKSLISEYLFNLVKREITTLVVVVSKVVLKEKYDSYIRVIRSLFKVFDTAVNLIT